MLRETSNTAISECFYATQLKNISRQAGIAISIKYIDPSYTIRSVPANPHDSAFCLLLGHKRGARRDEWQNEDGGWILEPPVHTCTHIASRFATQEDRSRRNALEQCSCLYRATAANELIQGRIEAELEKQ